MIKESTGDAIMTYSGRLIQPLTPDPNDIEIQDIAHALSNQCRFSGHSKYFYSVAQHCCHVSDLCPDKHKLGGLLHDATEAYLSDIARPIKRQPGFGEVYREAENRLMTAVVQRFGLPWDYENDQFFAYCILPEEVKFADNVMLRAEMKSLMPEAIFDEFWEKETLPFEIGFGPIKTWTPSQAKTEFLTRYIALSWKDETLARETD